MELKAHASGQRPPQSSYCKATTATLNKCHASTLASDRFLVSVCFFNVSGSPRRYCCVGGTHSVAGCAVLLGTLEVSGT